MSVPILLLYFFILCSLPGVVVGLIAGFYLFGEDDFSKRQERYRRMI